MFRKKFLHPCVEKFCEREVSRGWGNGVGRAGGVEGTVGIGWLPAEVVVDGVDEVDEVDPLLVVGVGNVIPCGSGFGCRL